MITMPDLQTALLDLLHELQGTDIKLNIGGGFGIYLKTDHVRRLGEPRSTNDLDLYLRPELLIQSAKLKPLAEAIARLGYQLVPGAEKYQFVKPGPGGVQAGSVKINILTGLQSRFEGTKVKTDARRARPNPSVGIHAHPVDEVPTLEEGLLQKTLDGKLGSGDPWQAEIFLAHPYTFLMMKLFAFKDRRNDIDKEFGRYHALDLYTILATTTEMEWKRALSFRDQHEEEPYIVEAGKLTLAELNALADKGGEISKGVLTLIFGTGNPQEVALSLNLWCSSPPRRNAKRDSRDSDFTKIGEMVISPCRRVSILVIFSPLPYVQFLRVREQGILSAITDILSYLCILHTLASGLRERRIREYRPGSETQMIALPGFRTKWVLST